MGKTGKISRKKGKGGKGKMLQLITNKEWNCTTTTSMD